MRCRNQTSQDLKKLQEKKPALGRDNDDGFVKHEEEKTLPVESNNESPLKMVNGSISENIKNLRGEEGCNPPPEVNVLFFSFLSEPTHFSHCTVGLSPLNNCN